MIIAVHEHGGRLQIRDGLITAGCDALALGLGASVGRYGPAVQLGATVGAILGQAIGLTRTGLRVLLGCGVAAAISASFNAPIAGVIFAHEVIIGHFSLRALAPITVASVVAVGVTRYHGFEYVALKLTEENLHLVVWEYAAYALLGLAAAGVALIYMKGILRAGDLANRDLLDARQSLVDAQNLLIRQQADHFVRSLILLRGLGVLFIDENGEWR